MGNIHLVTGYAGEAHVTSANDGVFNANMFGSGHYVLPIGNKFAAQIVSNNQIRILDGSLLMQGRFVTLDGGNYIDISVENGTQGYMRNDLIVARYTKSASSGVEDCNIVLIKGTASATSAYDPEYTNTDLLNDNPSVHDMPLYRVVLNGINIESVDPMFMTYEIMSDHASRKNNPHSVTKSQIGLGNVDNTSDSDKPISTAVNSALSAKADLNHSHSSFTNLMLNGLILTEGTDYGTSLPSSAPKGKLFFKKL